MGSSTKFWNRGSFTANVLAEGTPTITVPTDETFFINLGTFTANVSPTRVLAFSGLGWFQNFTYMNVNSGIVSTAGLQNSGTVNLAQDTILKAGTNSSKVRLWPNAPAGIAEPVIQGDGKVIFVENSLVELLPGTSRVENFLDTSAWMDGNGNLLITGTGTVGSIGEETTVGTGHWRGTGKTFVGSAVEPNAMLTIYGAMELSRQVVNNQSMSWVTMGNQEEWQDIEFKQGGMIVNNLGATLTLFSSCTQVNKLTSAVGAGMLLNDGIVDTFAGPVPLMVEVPYLPLVPGLPPQGTGGVLNVRTGQLRINKELLMARGAVNIFGGSTLICLEGILQSGGGINNKGEMEVTGGYTLTGGTLESFNSNLMGVAEFTADTIVHSGGSITNKGNFTVEGEYELSHIGSFTAQGMGVFAATVAMGSVAQTGGTFAISSYPVAFIVDEIYDYTLGTASVYPYPQPMTNSGSSFGELIVRGQDFTLGGIAAAEDGIHVVANGKLQIEMTAKITAGVLNDGRLDAALGAEITGSLTNNSIFHIGYTGSISSLENVKITGNFTQSGSGTLLVDAAYGNYTSDYITVTEVATLAGTLHVVSNYFDPQSISKIGTYGSRVGTFSTLISPGGQEIWYDDPWSNAFGIRPIGGGGGGGGGGGMPPP